MANQAMLTAFMNSIRDASPAWRHAKVEYDSVVETEYSEILKQNVDRADISGTIQLTLEYVMDRLKGSINSLSEDAFQIDYELRVNMDKPALYGPECVNVTVPVYWDRKDVAAVFYSSERQRDVILNTEIRAMVQVDRVTDLTKFANAAGLAVDTVRSGNPEQAASLLRVIKDNTRCQHKLTRLVKGCLLFLDHLETGAVKYEGVQINGLQYGVGTLLKTLKYGDSAYVFNVTPDSTAASVILQSMCEEYPHPVLGGVNHVSIPRDGFNVFVVASQIHDEKQHVTIAAETIWGTLLLYAEHFMLQADLEHALAIACTLRENRYLSKVRLPSVVSGCDLVYPCMAGMREGVTEKTMLSMEAARVIGRVHQMLALVLVKDLLTSANNNTRTKFFLGRDLRSALSRDWAGLVYYMSGKSCSNILKVTSEMMWLSELDDDDFEKIKGTSALEGFWLIDEPKRVLKNGVLRCLKAGYKNPIPLESRSLYFDALSVLQREIGLVCGVDVGRIPNGAFNLRLSNFREKSKTGAVIRLTVPGVMSNEFKYIRDGTNRIVTFSAGGTVVCPEHTSRYAMGTEYDWHMASDGEEEGFKNNDTTTRQFECEDEEEIPGTGVGGNPRVERTATPVPSQVSPPPNPRRRERRAKISTADPVVVHPETTVPEGEVEFVNPFAGEQFVRSSEPAARRGEQAEASGLFTAAARSAVPLEDLRGAIGGTLSRLERVQREAEHSQNIRIEEVTGDESVPKYDGDEEDEESEEEDENIYADQPPGSEAKKPDDDEGGDKQGPPGTGGFPEASTPPPQTPQPHPPQPEPPAPDTQGGGGGGGDSASGERREENASQTAGTSEESQRASGDIPVGGNRVEEEDVGGETPGRVTGDIFNLGTPGSVTAMVKKFSQQGSLGRSALNIALGGDGRYSNLGLGASSLAARYSGVGSSGFGVSSPVKWTKAIPSQLAPAKKKQDMFLPLAARTGETEKEDWRNRSLEGWLDLRLRDVAYGQFKLDKKGTRLKHMLALIPVAIYGEMRVSEIIDKMAMSGAFEDEVSRYLQWFEGVADTEANDYPERFRWFVNYVLECVESQLVGEDSILSEDTLAEIEDPEKRKMAANYKHEVFTSEDDIKKLIPTNQFFIVNPTWSKQASRWFASKTGNEPTVTRTDLKRFAIYADNGGDLGAWRDLYFSIKGSDYLANLMWHRISGDMLKEFVRTYSAVKKDAVATGTRGQLEDRLLAGDSYDHKVKFLTRDEYNTAVREIVNMSTSHRCALIVQYHVTGVELVSPQVYAVALETVKLVPRYQAEIVVPMRKKLSLYILVNPY